MFLLFVTLALSFRYFNNRRKYNIADTCCLANSQNCYPFRLAFTYSLFIRAIFLREISLGHSTSQAPVFVQLPKPSASICFTIWATRSPASIFPCGNRANWDTLAATNSMAEAFLQAAAQAPQPIQVAASKASSETDFSMGMVLASCGLPEVFTEI